MAQTSVDQSIVTSGVSHSMPIAADATVSRTIVDNGRVRVVAFTFDTGEQLTEHTATMPVVVQLISGALDFLLLGESHSLGPGDCVYLAAGEPHSLVAREPSRMNLVMIRDV